MLSPTQKLLQVFSRLQVCSDTGPENLQNGAFCLRSLYIWWNDQVLLDTHLNKHTLVHRCEERGLVRGLPSAWLARGGVSTSFAACCCGNEKSGSVFGWLSWLCSSAFLARSQDHAPRERRLMIASHGKALQRQRAKARGRRGRLKEDGGRER